jgi:hypothetical protein
MGDICKRSGQHTLAPPKIYKKDICRQRVCGGGGLRHAGDSKCALVQGRLKEARASLVRLRGETYQCEEELLYLERSDISVPDKTNSFRLVYAV